MLARSGLVGKNSSRPHLGPSLAIFCVGRKNRKNHECLPIFLGGPMGPIHPVWGNGCNISSAIRISEVCCMQVKHTHVEHKPCLQSLQSVLSANMWLCLICSGAWIAPRPRSHFGTWKNLESDMEKICPSSAKSICYFSVCH